MGKARVVGGKEALKIMAKDWDTSVDDLKKAGITDGYVKEKEETAHYALMTPAGWIYTNNIDNQVQEMGDRRRAYYAVAKAPEQGAVFIPRQQPMGEMKLPLNKMKQM